MSATELEHEYTIDQVPEPTNNTTIQQVDTNEPLTIRNIERHADDVANEILATVNKLNALFAEASKAPTDVTVCLVVKGHLLKEETDVEYTLWNVLFAHRKTQPIQLQVAGMYTE